MIKQAKEPIAISGILPIRTVSCQPSAPKPERPLLVKTITEIVQPPPECMKPPGKAGKHTTEDLPMITAEIRFRPYKRPKPKPPNISVHLNCQFCTIPIQNEVDASIHMQKWHSDIVDIDANACLKCQIVFSSKDILLRHLLCKVRVIIEGNEECPLCTIFIGNTSDTHYRLCHPKYVEKHWVQCDMCLKYFMPRKIHIHLVTCQLDQKCHLPKLECDVDLDVIDSESDWFQNFAVEKPQKVKNSTPESQNQLVCKICEETFHKPKQLIVHFQTHDFQSLKK